MYIALAILIAGILCGVGLRDILNQALLQRLTLAAIFLLLFLLGVAIGSNQKLLNQLPSLGVTAVIISLCCIAGSIAVSVLVTPFMRKKRRELPPPNAQ